MPEEKEENRETEGSAEARPTITIAEKQPADEAEAKPTITIAEKTD